MAGFEFRQAVLTGTKARIVLMGPSGAGKTYTGLRIGTRLAELEGTEFAVIDTEHRRSEKYADRFSFKVLNLGRPFTIGRYIEAIQAAQKAGFGILMVDSLSHVWVGEGGALDMVNVEAERFGGNRWAAWSAVTPQYRRLIETFTRYDGHFITTLRSKTAWEIERTSTGVRPLQIGLEPVIRDGTEYEFDLRIQLTMAHHGIVERTVYPVFDGQIIPLPGEELAEALFNYLQGAEAGLEGTIEETYDATHWYNDPRRQAQLAAFLEKQGLTLEEALTRLGVGTIYEFKGTPQDAAAQLQMKQQTEESED